MGKLLLALASTTTTTKICQKEGNELLHTSMKGTAGHI
jgi:hypothetical protein